MNKIFIVGNLTRDPEMRSTRDGTPVCTFTVAVNRRKQNAQAGQPNADFFRVTAWRGLGENCARYLAKGKKVSVVGEVSVSTYTGNDGSTRASMEVNADDVEFLTPRDAGLDTEEMKYQSMERQAIQQESAAQPQFVQVEDDELPF